MRDYRAEALAKCEKVYSVVKNAGTVYQDKETFGGDIAKIKEVELVDNEKKEIILVGGELVKIAIKCEIYSNRKHDNWIYCKEWHGINIIWRQYRKFGNNRVLEENQEI